MICRMLFAILISFRLWAAENSNVIVTEAIGRAGTNVVTSREIQIAYAVEQALNEPAKKANLIDRKSWSFELNSETASKALGQSLLELVVQMEAENFAVGLVSAEDLTGAEKHVVEMLKPWPIWQNFEVSDAELRQILKRKLRARNFLKFKTETSGVQISDEEALKYFEKNKVKFGNLPFAQYKENIKEALSRAQVEEKLKDWFEILKRKYRVQYLGRSG